jgi:hypothetical protein
MQVAWAVVASTAGGAPPTSSACWPAVSVSRRSQDRHWLRGRRATYAAVLRVYTRIEFDLRSACYQDKRTRIDRAPWGAALASLSLVASEEVAAATSRFTEAMREFKTFGLGGKHQGRWAAAGCPGTRPGPDGLCERGTTVARSLTTPLPWQLGGPPDCATGTCQSGVTARCQG